MDQALHGQILRTVSALPFPTRCQGVVLPNSVHDHTIEALTILFKPPLEPWLVVIFGLRWAKSMDFASRYLVEVGFRIVQRGHFNFVAFPLVRPQQTFAWNLLDRQTMGSVF